MPDAKTICISWQTEAMPVPAFCYFHADCLDQHTFKSENIANGKRREVEPIHVASWGKCDGCGKLLVEGKPVYEERESEEV